MPTRRRLVRVGIHQGPCVAVTANERLDYFGTTVNIASRVEHEARGGEVAATADVCETADGQAGAGRRDVSGVGADASLASSGDLTEPVRLFRLRPGGRLAARGIGRSAAWRSLARSRW